MPKIKMSKFIHLLHFKVPSGTEAQAGNTRGDVEITYVDLDVDNPMLVWASIEPVVGRELLVARQMRGDITHKVTCHYNSSINHRLIFLWDGRTFNVGPPVSEDERQVFMSFYAGEIIG